MNVEKEVLSILTEKSKRKVLKTDKIVDLGIDSLDLVMIVVDVEQKTNISIPDEKIKNLVFVKDIITCFQSEIKS